MFPVSEIKLHVRREGRVSVDVPFGSLLVNGEHIYRFDAPSSARLAAANLKKALRSAGIKVNDKVTEDGVK